MTEESYRDHAVYLYELSLMSNQMQALFSFFEAVASDYYCDFPKNTEEKVKYETSCAVTNTIRMICKKLVEEIEVGRRLSESPVEEGSEDAGTDGHKRGRIR